MGVPPKQGGSLLIGEVNRYDVVTPHLNRLDETVIMIGHNIHFKRVIQKIISKLSLLYFIWSTA